MLANRHGQRTTHDGQRAANRRRGVTLVEMLVTVAVLVIMMTILVQIFQAATGSVSAAKAYQQLDDQLRRLDGIIRTDLEGATARFTPPLDPAQNLGYFEYGENEFADSQGEDGDDYIRFTAKAPPGRPFTGRFWPNAWSNSSGQSFPATLPTLPITITSDYAEIIYFLRNGNLYRRVFLVVPDLQSVILPSINNQAFINSNTGVAIQPAVFGGSVAVSWQGVNDLSAHPAPTGPNANTAPTAQTQASQTIVLNTLGNLTNRENRAFYPRFSNDFFNADPAAGSKIGSSVPDGIPDDQNQDNLPDLYPSLYPGLFDSSSVTGGTGLPLNSVTGTTNNHNPLIFAPAYPAKTSPLGVGFLAFPYVFPGAYSQAQVVSHDAFGWIHAPSPHAAAPDGTLIQFDTGGGKGTYTSLDYLNYLNHNPLDVGDNLPVAAQAQSTEYQTWWGFPTWRETLSPFWNDPTVQVNVGPNVMTTKIAAQTPNGLNYGSLSLSTGVLANPGTDTNLLPPMAAPSSFNGNFSIYRLTPQLYCDSAGGSSGFMSATLWPLTWEDDLILTNVRSFDVKAYDNALANFGDLGWADDLRLYLPFNTLYGYFYPGSPPAISSTPQTVVWPPIDPTKVTNTPQYPTLQTMAHEGRMPPLFQDNRLDYQYPNPTYVNAANFSPQYPGFPNYSSNVGDDNSGIVRLRRVWDTWSTDYSRAPATAVDKTNGGYPVGPPFSPPVYPSYPPPYPAPLRGIQIQIRVADPSNQRVKSLTIRQDFTDKL